MKYIAAILLFFLAGCVHVMDNEQISVSYNLPNDFKNQNSINSLNTNKKILEYKDPITEMIHLLNDDEFKKLLEYAVKENRDLLILESKIRQAKYQTKGPLGTMLPRVSGSIDASKKEGTYSVNGSASFSWELDIYGRLYTLYKSSKEQIKFAEENLVNGYVTLAADTAVYYFSMQKAYAQYLYSLEMLNNYKNILDIYKEMRNTGLIDEEEFIKVTKDYLSAENNANKYSLEVEKNKNALYVLLNSSDINISPVEYYSIEFKPNLPYISSIPSVVILNRPDVRKAVFTLNSELYKHYSRKMALFPSISVGGNIGNLLASPTGIGDFVWSIIGSITAPIFNRQELYANLKVQEESVKQAELSLQNTINIAVSDIENASYAMDRSDKSLVNTRKILLNAENSFKILKSSWNNGIIDKIKYLRARNDLLQSQISYYSSWYDNIFSAVTLYKAFGGSFSPPEINIKESR